MNPFAKGRKQNSLRDDTLRLRMVDNWETKPPRLTHVASSTAAISSASALSSESLRSDRRS